MPDLETAQIRLTCYNSNVYEPSDVRALCLLLSGMAKPLSNMHVCAHSSIQDTFLLVDALQSVAERWREQPPRT